jgi:hypothetical protein
MQIRNTVAVLVVGSFLWNSSAALAQQQHVVDSAALTQAVAAQAATDQQNRDAVLGLLHRTEVREMADRLGLSVTRAESALLTLNSTELASLAGQARVADDQLAGGSQTIVLSLTTLLLIIIVVLLIAR